MNENQCLVVVDIQNDFLETGALPVPEGSQIIPTVNKLLPLFKHIVFTQDWHPKDHISFADNHDGKKPYDTINLAYGDQVLWPAHCVQESEGAKLASGLNGTGKEKVIKKGCNRGVDSYSAFLEADRKTKTGLADWLKQHSINELFFCGLATDFCVSWSALDAAEEGFKVTIIRDACKPIDLNGSLQKAEQEWKKVGIQLIESKDLQE